MWILKILHSNSLKSKPSLQINYKYLLLYHGAQHLEGQNGQDLDKLTYLGSFSDHDSVSNSHPWQVPPSGFLYFQARFWKFRPRWLGPISVFFFVDRGCCLHCGGRAGYSQVAYKSPMSLNGFTASIWRTRSCNPAHENAQFFRNVQGALGWHSHWILVDLEGSL